MLSVLVSLQCVEDFVSSPEQPPCAGACTARIEVEPSSGTITRMGGALAPRATTFDGQGTIVLGRQVWWRSLNPRVVTVDTATGAVTAVGSGQVIVEAMTTLGAEGVLRGYALVTVAAPADAPVGVLVSDASSGHSQLNALWGSSPDTVYAVGTSGTFRRRRPDGTWEALDAANQPTLFGVVGLDSGLVFLVGDSGTVLRYRSGAGAFRDTTGTTATLRGVWAASPTAVYAVGSSGTILRFGGREHKVCVGGAVCVVYYYIWESDSSGTTQGLRAVWGSGAHDIYAVGDGGTILHFDGTAWGRSSSGTAAVLTSVWGTGPDEVYVTSADGVVLRGSWRGGWRAALRDSTASFTSVWGISSDEVYVGSADGRILRWDGERWVRLPGASGAAVRSLWGTATGPLVAVGDGGLVLTARRGGPARLVFTALPMADVSANVPFDLTVAVVDGAGQVDTTWADSVTLGLAGGAPGESLLGTTTQWAERGVVRFTGLRFPAAGSGYVLTATAPGLPPAQSPPLAVLGGEPERLRFRVQPAAATAGVAFAPAVVVGGVDENGGNVALADSVTVTLSLVTGVQGVRLYGDTVARASGGEARFANVFMTNAGEGRRLRAAAGTLAADTSTSFAVAAGPRARLVLFPSDGATFVSASPVTYSTTGEDAYGNPTGPVEALTIWTDNGVVGGGSPIPATSADFTPRNSGQASVFAWTTHDAAQVVVNVVLSPPGPVRTWTPDATVSGVTTADLWDLYVGYSHDYTVHRVIAVGAGGTVVFNENQVGGLPWRRCDLSVLSLSSRAIITGIAAAGAGARMRFSVVDRVLSGSTAHQVASTFEASFGGYKLDVCTSGMTLTDLVAIDTDSSTLYVPRGWGAGLTMIALTGFNGLWRCDSPVGTCTSQFSTPSDVFVRDVHAFALENVFLVGDRGQAWHRQGATTTSIPISTTETLLGVWGTTENDVFAVGTGGVIYHWNGSAWQAQASGTAQRLWGVWGSTSSDVYAVGDGGTILRYDGTAWTPMNSGTTADLHAISGNGGPNVFVVGSGGTVLIGSR